MTAGLFNCYADKLTKLAKMYGEDNISMGERQYYGEDENIFLIPVKLNDHTMKRNGLNFLADELDMHTFILYCR